MSMLDPTLGPSIFCSKPNRSFPYAISKSLLLLEISSYELEKNEYVV